MPLKTNLPNGKRALRKGAVKFVSSDKNLFYPTLKKRVEQYFTDRCLSKYGNAHLMIKTLILLLLYLLPFVAILVWAPGWILSLALWLLMGIGVAGLGMSVMHDANHGAYSDNRTINWCMAHVLNIMGGSTTNWKLQHNILHHTYTNIHHMDDDIASKPALRLSPHSPRRSSHRFQAWHAFALYGLSTIYWVTAKDFLQFVRYHKEGVSQAPAGKRRLMLIRLVLGKLLYFGLFIIIPIWAFGIPAAQVLTGFLLMHFVAGLILTVVFQLAHTLEGTSHPLPDPEGIIDNDWAIHQMNTTMNFAPGNALLSWYVGGLNFQVEHHLFPRIAHIHYPAIAPIVRATANEFHIPYLSNDSFGKALKAHLAFLRKLGHAPDWLEAIG